MKILDTHAYARTKKKKKVLAGADMQHLFPDNLVVCFPLQKIITFLPFGYLNAIQDVMIFNYLTQEVEVLSSLF